MSLPRLFVMISDQMVTAYPWSGGVFGQGRTFGQTPEGYQEFDQWLDAVPMGEDYILVDLADEELRPEVLPLVRGPNRRELLNRQMDKLFRSAVYRLANSQGEDKKNKQERFLFSAVMDATRISPWMAVLLGKERRVMGIWSLPLLCRTVLRLFNRRTDQALLVSRNSGGLRITYFSRGRTMVSRLTPVHLDTPEGILEEMQLEVEKTRGYINSLRLLNQEQPLDVFLLDHGPLWSTMQPACEAMDAKGGGNLYRCHPVNGDDLASQFGLSHEVGQTGLDLLFGQMLFKDSPANHYALASELKRHHTLLARLWMGRVAMGLPVVGLLVGAWPFFQGLSLQEQLPRQEMAIRQARHQLQEAEEHVPASPAKGRFLEETVLVHQALVAERSQPLTMILTVGPILSRHETLRIDGMEWKSANNSHETVGAAEPGNKPATVHVQDEEKALFHIAHFKGQIVPFRGDFRKAISQVEAFVEEVKTAANVHEAKAIQLPLNLGSSSAISGEAGLSGSESQKTASFEIRVVLKVPYAQP